MFAIHTGPTASVSTRGEHEQRVGLLRELLASEDVGES